MFKFWVRKSDPVIKMENKYSVYGSIGKLVGM